MNVGREIVWEKSELPQPTDNIEGLMADMRRWGYCLIAHAVELEKLGTIRRRLEEQADAERQLELHHQKDFFGE